MTDRLLIGTDEAGYGPNLGPLVVVATAWTFPESVSPANLWQELADVLTDKYKSGDRRLYVADSKSVYSSGDGLESLEVPVLAFLRTLGLECSDIEAVATALTPADFPAQYQSEPWNGNTTLPLPTDSCCDHIAEWTGLLKHAMEDAEVRLTGVRARILFPEEFNAQVAKTDSKGSVLSSATLTLVRELSDRYPASHTTVFCDKHGGRNRYDEVIAAHFDDQFVFRLEESRERSRYRMGPMEFCFRTKAEALLPVALASMIAKYLREVLMRQFNTWWQTHVPNLKPTQGYPVDAKRFRHDISTAVTRLGIPDDVLWRSR
jgi:ribonuclease HII